MAMLIEILVRLLVVSIRTYEARTKFSGQAIQAGVEPTSCEHNDLRIQQSLLEPLPERIAIFVAPTGRETEQQYSASIVYMKFGGGGSAVIAL